MQKIVCKSSKNLNSSYIVIQKTDFTACLLVRKSPYWFLKSWNLGNISKASG